MQLRVIVKLHMVTQIVRKHNDDDFYLYSFHFYSCFVPSDFCLLFFNVGTSRQFSAF